MRAACSHHSTTMMKAMTGDMIKKKKKNRGNASIQFAHSPGKNPMILWTFVSCRVPVATTFTCRCIDDWSPEWNHALKTLPHHIDTITEATLLWTRRRPVGTLTAKTLTGDPTRSCELYLEESNPDTHIRNTSDDPTELRMCIF